MRKLKEVLEPFVKVYLESLQIDQDLTLEDRESAIKSLVSKISFRELRKLNDVYNLLGDEEEDWLDPAKEPPIDLDPVLAIFNTGVGLRVLEAWRMKDGTWNFKTSGTCMPYGSPLLYKTWPKVPQRLLDEEDQ
jgi:hypothetical protein